MESLILGVIVFAISAFVLTKLLGGKTTGKSKRSLEDISRQFYETANDQSVLLEEEKIDRLGEALSNVPFFGGLYRKVKLSGIGLSFTLYLVIFLSAVAGLTFLLGNLLNEMYLVGLLLAVIAIVTVSNLILGYRINKREEYYLTAFPDAVDMIVRSVKSGQPLLSALKMIANSTTKPLADDVQRVIDEVAYGRPLPDALRHMADRVGFLDMKFFVVILSVQQETGGNLSEVLSNLATIIRKRKQLKLKIRALTAQSKMTTYIFACIPFLQMAAVYLIKPDYLRPYTTVDAGVYALMTALTCIAIAIFLGKKISNLDV